MGNTAVEGPFNRAIQAAGVLTQGDAILIPGEGTASLVELADTILDGFIHATGEGRRFTATVGGVRAYVAVLCAADAAFKRTLTNAVSTSAVGAIRRTR